MRGQDNFGDRMKTYERIETGQKFLPLAPIYARLDGRSFSNFTRGMDRPFDRRFSEVVQEVTRYLVKETGATLGYTHKVMKSL